MKDKYYDIMLKIWFLLMISFIGASFGANYADNQNKEDILNVVNAEVKPTYLSFSYDGETRYFMVEEITKYNYNDYVNITLMNETVNK